MSDEQHNGLIPSAGGNAVRPMQDLDPLRTIHVNGEYVGKNEAPRADYDVDDETPHAERIIDSEGEPDDLPGSPQDYYNKLLRAWKAGQPSQDGPVSGPVPGQRGLSNDAAGAKGPEKAGTVNGGAALAAGAGALLSGAGSALSGLGSGFSRLSGRHGQKAPTPPRSLLVAAHYLSSLDAHRSEMTALAKSLSRHPHNPAAAAQMARLAMLGRSAARLSRTLERKGLSSGLGLTRLVGGRITPDVGAIILTDTQNIHRRIKEGLSAEFAHLAPDAKDVRTAMEKLMRRIDAMVQRLMKAMEPLLAKMGHRAKAGASAPASAPAP